MIRFNPKSFAISIVLFCILVFIAVFVKDSIVRPFFGDTLAVIWLYFVLKTVINISGYRLSVVVLMIAYCVEVAQFFNIVTLLGISHIKIVRVVLGATFDLHDILAYTIGWVMIVGVIKISSIYGDSG